MALLDNQTSLQYYDDATLHGGYQYITLDVVINNFLLIYTGENKIIKHIPRTDVFFYASQCLAELNYDTLRSNKSLEIEIPSSLLMVLPQDYVNYTHISVVGSNGIKSPLYPDYNTSDPIAAEQDSQGALQFIGNNLNTNADPTVNTNQSNTWQNYQSASTESDNISADSDEFNPFDYAGQRYGLDPQRAQKNGFFYINNHAGRIHFSSNVSGKTVVLDYISDGLGATGDMLVPKMAEKAMYSSILCAIVMTRADLPEYQVNRFKKQKFADVRQAKLRLSNIKAVEITQVLKGKSKQIK